MTISEWPDAPSAQLAEVREQLGVLLSEHELLAESYADLQLAAEDRGWELLSARADATFTRDGLGKIARNLRVLAVAAPLPKRGLALRNAYVWGQGVTVAARAGEDADQDVNAVVQAFWDDESNQVSLTGAQAQEELERTGLGCDGNVFLALHTDQRTGRVQVRSTLFDEVQDILTNPEDRKDPWYYLRQYEAVVIEPGFGGSTRTRNETRRVLHPDVRHRPRMRPKTINGIPVMWDAPIVHVAVNRHDGWKFGVGDLYAAAEWVRLYDGFLLDWAKLVKALSRFAWRTTGDRTSRAQKAAQAMTRSYQPTDTKVPAPGPVGGAANLGPGVTLEAIPKTGATIDSESGRPLAALVAAALGVPVTMLLSDPGATGARAVAETLDRPTILEMGQRRSLWAATIKTITDYVIDQAVKAPAGPLAGTISRDDYGREVITLTGDVERTVDVEFPPLDDLDPKSLLEALAAADGMGVVPPLVLLRLILQALRVKDADEIIASVTDPETGEFLDPYANAGDAAVEAWRRGRDPVALLTGQGD